MKKKIIGIMSLVLAGTMMTASLTGCSTTAKATDITIEDGDTIIVEEEEVETETEVETESESDEITETEVIGGDGEATDSAEFAGAEDENIVLYAEIEKYGDYDLSLFNFAAADEDTIIAVTDIPVYCYDGVQVGYIKAGAAVTPTERGENSRWSRFENPIAGTDYDYLYVFDDDLPQEEIPMLSAEEVKDAIIATMLNRGDELPTILDAPTDDMEVYECRILREDDPASFTTRRMKAIENDDTFHVGNYMTYYVECEEDGEFAICRIYYKDPRY